MVTPTPTAADERLSLLETSFPASPPTSSDMQSSQISTVGSPPNDSVKERRKSESSLHSPLEPVPVAPLRKQHPHPPPPPPPRPSSVDEPKPVQNATKPAPYMYSFANDFISSETRKLSKSVEKLKMTAEERYENITSMHLSTLAEIAENFPNLPSIWRAQQGKEMAFCGAKWCHFTVVGNTPLLVTNCATFYPAVYRENGSQVLFHIYLYSFLYYFLHFSHFSHFSNSLFLNHGI